jgi:hypothetical protein
MADAAPVAPAARRKKPTSNKVRARLQQARLAQQRAKAEQLSEWMRRFDVNRSGALERDELSALLQHLHPEAGTPDPRALDLLITQATEIRTYSLQLSGNPNGAVGVDCLNGVVSGYAMFLLASAAFDRLSTEGVVALRDLPGLMREANDGVACDSSDVDFVVDCCNSSVHGGLDSASAISREELMPAFAAWKLAQLEEGAELAEADDGAEPTDGADGAGLGPQPDDGVEDDRPPAAVAEDAEPHMERRVKAVAAAHERQNAPTSLSGAGKRQSSTACSIL